MSLVLPFFAVFLGALLVFFGVAKSKVRLQLLLAFSGAFLLATTITVVLPEIFSHGNGFISYWILVGIVIQIILENLTHGAEHGHLHINSSKKIPWVLIVGIYLHAFIEGLPIHHHEELLWAVVVHKLPIAMLITAALWQTKASKTSKLLILFGFGIMTPLGSLINTKLPFLHSYTQEITALVAGVLLHISTTILFESAENHKFKTSKIIAILLGLGLVVLMV